MGGGDLNTKKSWHPTNARNQERVWKAEQKDLAEKKKLAELQRQIQEERDLEEAKKIARNSGYIDDNSDKKLEWMYKGQQLNREEYLTGRAIDKNFEELSTTAEQQPHPGIVVPKNHVEHEVIPFSIRQFKGTVAPTEQVDMARKVMEDPLMLIKQKEMEMRRKVLENPVRLKEVYKLLKQEKAPGSRKDKKPKKEKKKKKNRSSSSSDSDLDKVLAEKYKKLQGILQTNDSDEDGNLDKMIGEKFQTLSKELDKITGSKKKNKKKNRSDSSSSDDFHVTKHKRSESPKQRRTQASRIGDNSRQRENFSARTNQREIHARRSSRSPNFRYINSSPRGRQNPIHQRRNSRERYQSDQSPRRRGFSPQRSHRNSFREREKSPARRRRTRSPRNHRSSPRRYQRSASPRKRTFSPKTHQNSPNHNSKKLPEKSIQLRKSESSDSLDSSSERVAANYDSDSPPPTKKAFGLVAADGKRLKISKSTRQRSRSPKPTSKPVTTASSSSKPEKRAKPAKLSREEIEAKLKEMEANAKWRDKERTEKVHKHREKEKREQEDITKEFDQDFLNRQLKKTSNSMQSVESRIKSNLGSIQRSSRVMDSNFAKR